MEESIIINYVRENGPKIEEAECAFHDFDGDYGDKVLDGFFLYASETTDNPCPLL